MASNGTTNTNTSGESNVSIDYTLQSGSDCIPDKVMAEIARRIIGFVEGSQSSSVVFSVLPPTDKQKLWVELDSTGSIIGTIKRYNSATGQWVDDIVAIPTPIPAQVYVEGNSTNALIEQTLVFTHSFGSGSYHYMFIFTDQPRPDTVWWESAQDSNSVTIKIINGQSSTGGVLNNYIKVVEIL